MERHTIENADRGIAGFITVFSVCSHLSSTTLELSWSCRERAVHYARHELHYASAGLSLLSYNTSRSMRLPSSSARFQSCDDFSPVSLPWRRITLLPFRLDQLFAGGRINKLPITDMLIALLFLLLRRFWSPGEVVHRPALSLHMLVGAFCVRARIEATRCIEMSELAVGIPTTDAKTAQRCIGVLEGTIRLGTIREEFTLLFGLVGSDQCW